MSSWIFLSVFLIDLSKRNVIQDVMQNRFEVDFLPEKCWSCDSQLGIETVSGGGDEL
jgi:hypothetical protein